MNTLTMTEQEFRGYLYGLSIAALLCEQRAGKKASHNAMAILELRTTSELHREQFRKQKNDFELSDWIQVVHHA